MHRFFALLFALALAVAFIACDKKDTAAPAPATDAAAQPAAAAAKPIQAPKVGSGLAGKLKPSAVTPDIPADQSAPKKTVAAVFAAFDIVLNPEYRAAYKSGGGDKAKAYTEAMARLHQLFGSAEHFRNVAAYLDLIQVQGFKLDDAPVIEGDSAKLGVVLRKGDNLSVDPMFLGETSKTEARITIDMKKMEERWVVIDFGGLARAGQ
jgi:hypothetical protein